MRGSPKSESRGPKQIQIPGTEGRGGRPPTKGTNHAKRGVDPNLHQLRRSRDTGQPESPSCRHTSIVGIEYSWKQVDQNEAPPHEPEGRHSCRPVTHADAMLSGRQECRLSVPGINSRSLIWRSVHSMNHHSRSADSLVRASPKGRHSRTRRSALRAPPCSWHQFTSIVVGPAFP
jgi:hypothetical protein